MNIAIGTHSQYKVNAILKSLLQLDIIFTYTLHPVASGVSEQPLNGEVQQGSINRAQQAIDESNNAEIGIGAEFGYVETVDSLKMLCYASIAVHNGNIYSEHSSSLELPAAMVEALRSDVHVHTLVDEALNKVRPGPLSWSFSDRMTKRRLISECCTNVMLRYMLDGLLY